MVLSDFVSVVCEFDKISDMLDKELYFYISEDEENKKVKAININSVGFDGEHIFLAAKCPYCDNDSCACD